ncbi:MULTISPECIES: type I-F CRISPR-associated endoribonuclease Cas6/Csy4 [unclassified Halomonas]|uniref:type I-F CRISPR-associated endoribonuclease Cas6/Csy4 n=1 Tax=unclassified Halomonas TaxID=2609666 RepID=UPI002887911B|nr:MULTISPECIES: type I-F CRISPR-associated endoribonuclease Cas6/Csy4 [unclassified Halomonas]MDT0499968.1 type I-F CRISPR-associated endoribonuclease Cas6/Csy4 [Halomonas sp. PAR7]MDT0512372.1 type I-F CRISPR-associated endoribonuclease Cas6/Csy4 [Halomonas sp. LES1]MDT0591006.1 type I-F CRISPR-associated endoribonuclease Cas6/Csy4 [Halomonas sp. PAR8]
MDHYLDIRLRPDPDFPPALLMGALYSKLHRALVDLEANDIGVSFPDHKLGVRARTPGDRLRLHGRGARLEQLMANAWLTGMRDHVSLQAIQGVPVVVQHRVVRRRQFNTGSLSRAKRYAQRHDIEIEEAQRLMETPAARQITLPFVQVSSRSSGQRFALFIEHGQPQSQPVAGRFNHYGLSSEATVPWF